MTKDNRKVFDGRRWRPQAARESGWVKLELSLPVASLPPIFSAVEIAVPRQPGEAMNSDVSPIPSQILPQREKGKLCERPLGHQPKDCKSSVSPGPQFRPLPS